MATFLVSALSPEMRRDSEQELLRNYYERIVCQGVTEYDFDKCLQDYRLTMLSWFCRVVFVIASYDLGNDRGRALLQGLLDRVSAAVIDLECGELIS